MLVCNCHADFTKKDECDDVHDWSASSKHYPNMEEFDQFITKQHQSSPNRVIETTADPSELHGKQLAIFELIKKHIEGNDSTPIPMIISGTAGTG
jgi:hypothetical protein